MFHVMEFSKYAYIVAATAASLFEWSWVETKPLLQTNVWILGWRDCVTEQGIKIRHVKQERAMIWRCDRPASYMEVYNPEMYKTDPLTSGINYLINWCRISAINNTRDPLAIPFLLARCHATTWLPRETASGTPKKHHFCLFLPGLCNVTLQNRCILSFYILLRAMIFCLRHRYYLNSGDIIFC